MNFTNLIILSFTAILAIGSVSKGLKDNKNVIVLVKDRYKYHKAAFLFPRVSLLPMLCL